MTPRLLFAWLNLARQRRRGALAEQLAITVLGSRGDPDDVKRQLEAWED
jgi:hypothetical protein